MKLTTLVPICLNLFPSRPGWTGLVWLIGAAIYAITAPVMRAASKRPAKSTDGSHHVPGRVPCGRNA
jgi:hypothetical protein